MIRIALPVFRARIAPVLDSCLKVLVVQIEDDGQTETRELYVYRLSSAERVNVLKREGVTTLVCSGISETLQTMLEGARIHVMMGIAGPVEDVLSAFVSNRLDDPRFSMPGRRGKFGESKNNMEEKRNFEETRMYKLLLISPDKDALSTLAQALEAQENVDLSRAESGSEALQMASDTAFDLVVTDEKLGDMTGLDFANRLLSVNPMILCAAVSPLSPKDFHEASEGLGLLPQLLPKPGEKEAYALLQNMKALKALAAGATLRPENPPA